MLQVSMSVTDKKELVDLSESLSTDFDEEAGSPEDDLTRPRKHDICNKINVIVI